MKFSILAFEALCLANLISPLSASASEHSIVGKTLGKRGYLAKMAKVEEGDAGEFHAIKEREYPANWAKVDESRVTEKD